jgi:hypothetical protein
LLSRNELILRLLLFLQPWCQRIKQWFFLVRGLLSFFADGDNPLEVGRKRIGGPVLAVTCQGGTELLPRSRASSKFF